MKRNDAFYTGITTALTRRKSSIPRSGIIFYLPSPNDTGKFLLPTDADIRTATGWVSGTVNLFYDADGVPIAVTASEIATWSGVNQWNVLFHLVSADTETGRLAIYAQDTPIAVLNKALKILRETALDLTPTIFFNGVDTTGNTSYTGGPTYVQDNLGVIRTPAANYPAVEGMRLDGTTYKDTLIDGVTPIVPSVDQPTRTFDAGFTAPSAGPTFKDYTRPTPLTAPGWLCEPARTNLLRYSDDFNDVVWQKPAGVTLQPYLDDALYDDVYKFTPSGVFNFIKQSFAAQYTTYTFSMWLRLDVGQSPRVLNLGLTESGLYTYLWSNVTVTDQWERFSVTKTILEATSLTLSPLIQDRNASGFIPIYIHHAQLEVGSYPTSIIPTTTTTVTRAGTVLTYPTAGKIRSNDIALKLSVVPRGTGQSGYLWGSYTDASNFCYLSINPYDITFKSVVAGISKDVAIASYTHTKDVPFEVILCKSTQGSQLLVRKYTGGAWQAWVRGGLSVTGGNLVLSTSYTLGSFNNTSQFTGNISEIDSLLIPSGIANPTAWVESQWDVNGAGSNPVIFNHTFTGLTLLDGVLQTKSATDSVTINWGDGTSNTYAGTDDTAFTHTYASATTIYNVTYTAVDDSVLTKLSFTDRAGGKVGGNLSLPSGMTYFVCAGFNTLSGTLSLPAGMTTFVCQGYNTLGGNLSLPSGMTYFVCYGSNTLSGYTPSTKASNQQRFALAGLNTLTSSMVDSIINDYAAAGGTWAGDKIFSLTVLTASNRTSASDAGWTTLGTKGLVTLTITLR